MPTLTITEQEYKSFSQYLQEQCGIVLGDSKQYLVRSRLSPLLSKYNFNTLSQLIDRVVKGMDRNLKVAVIDAMTTNETLWFRDDYPFKLLADRLLPELAQKKKPIKIWSAASSSGQEPYSIAMTILELQQKRPGLLPPTQIIATDISNTMLEQCRQGIYDNLALARGLSPERKKMFFEDLGDGRMRINSKVRSMVQFREQNLMSSYALLGRFDLIFCRNVLIYFSPEMKNQVLTQMAGALNKDSYLMLGASESLTGLNDKYEMIRCNPGIMYKVR